MRIVYFFYSKNYLIEKNPDVDVILQLNNEKARGESFAMQISIAFFTSFFLLLLFLSGKYDSKRLLRIGSVFQYNNYII